MKPETMFGEMLGLGRNWRVTQTRYEASSNLFVISVEETPQLWEGERCPRDGAQPVVCHDHVELRRWRHLNVFNKECVIECALPRGRCSLCGHTYRVTPPWEGLSKHFSKEFEAFALTLAREMPVKKAAEILGEHDTRIWRMVQAHVATAHQRQDWSAVTTVGVDELSARRGHRYVTVFADLDRARVLYATPGKDATTWNRFAAEMPRHDGHPHALTHVSMDMSPAYQKGVRENCRNAQVVFDKFHLIAHANQAVDEVRQAETRRGEPAARDQLRGSLWLWRKNPENLTPQQKVRMDRIDHTLLHTSKAYQCRLVLQEIYRLPYRSQARRRLARWCRWLHRAAAKAPHLLLRPMAKLAAMVERHFEGILAHWDNRHTNAFMEGLNSVFSAVKRKARGYRTTQNLICMLYFTAGKLNLPSCLSH
jgi:transposase